MIKLVVISTLMAALFGLAVGLSMVMLIEWAWRMKATRSRATRSRVRARLDFFGRHVGGRSRLMDAEMLDQRPEWDRTGERIRQRLNGKKTMEARWGA